MRLGRFSRRFAYKRAMWRALMSAMVAATKREKKDADRKKDDDKKKDDDNDDGGGRERWKMAVLKILHDRGQLDAFCR